MRFGNTPVRVELRFDAELKGEAICWYGDNDLEVTDFLGYLDKDEHDQLVVLTPDGAMSIQVLDWIVKMDAVPGLAAPATADFFNMLFRVKTI